MTTLSILQGSVKVVLTMVSAFLITLVSIVPAGRVPAWHDYAYAAASGLAAGGFLAAHSPITQPPTPFLPAQYFSGTFKDVAAAEPMTATATVTTSAAPAPPAAVVTARPVAVPIANAPIAPQVKP